MKNSIGESVNNSQSENEVSIVNNTVKYLKKQAGVNLFFSIFLAIMTALLIIVALNFNMELDFLELGVFLFMVIFFGVTSITCFFFGIYFVKSKKKIQKEIEQNGKIVSDIKSIVIIRSKEEQDAYRKYVIKKTKYFFCLAFPQLILIGGILYDYYVSQYEIASVALCIWFIYNFISAGVYCAMEGIQATSGEIETGRTVYKSSYSYLNESYEVTSEKETVSDGEGNYFPVLLGIAFGGLIWYIIKSYIIRKRYNFELILVKFEAFLKNSNPSLESCEKYKEFHKQIPWGTSYAKEYITNEKNRIERNVILEYIEENFDKRLEGDEIAGVLVQFVRIKEKEEKLKEIELLLKSNVVSVNDCEEFLEFYNIIPWDKPYYTITLEAEYKKTRLAIVDKIREINPYTLEKEFGLEKEVPKYYFWTFVKKVIDERLNQNVLSKNA